MKKGCFIPAIIISTILLAIIFYIFTNKFDDFILKPAKNLTHNIVFGEIEKKLNNLNQNSTNVDSLKKLITIYIDDVFKAENINVNEIVKMADSINVFLTDSLITNDEVKRFYSNYDSLKNIHSKKENNKSIIKYTD